jgi:hypothetical protein
MSRSRLGDPNCCNWDSFGSISDLLFEVQDVNTLDLQWRSSAEMIRFE